MKPPARFRGNSNNSNCSPRYLNANNSVANTNMNNGGSDQSEQKYFFTDEPSYSCLGMANNYKTVTSKVWQ